MTHISYKQFFATLSGDSRLEILQHLRNNGPQNVSEIAAGTGQEQSAVSHNLKKMLARNCVSVDIQGKNRLYTLNDETIVPLLELADLHIQKFCKSECSECQCTTSSYTSSSRDLISNKKGQ